MKKFPQIGKEDERFESYKYEIRYLIEGKFRIYYEYTGEQIFVLNIVNRNQIGENLKLF